MSNRSIVGWRCAKCSKIFAWTDRDPPFGSVIRSDSVIYADGTRPTSMTPVKCCWCKQNPLSMNTTPRHQLETFPLGG